MVEIRISVLTLFLPTINARILLSGTYPSRRQAFFRDCEFRSTVLRHLMMFLF